MIRAWRLYNVFSEKTVALSYNLPYIRKRIEKLDHPSNYLVEEFDADKSEWISMAGTCSSLDNAFYLLNRGKRCVYSTERFMEDVNP